jgi:crotonobetainyl-CoA:carnitine CoA-transferase CaiB-like acyl-CoA transferase
MRALPRISRTDPWWYSRMEGEIDPRLAAWAASGAMALTGRADEPPLGPPEPLVDGVQALGERLARASAAIGSRVDVDALALLGERAALEGLSRRSPMSCGGGTRLIPTADGLLAVALARDWDHDLVPAWLEVPAERAQDPWATVTDVAATKATEWLEERAALVGLAAAGCRGVAAGTTQERSSGVRAHVTGVTQPCVDLRGCVVLDLSALWAGPLCSQLLLAAGATVIKVEALDRPDGARRGPAAFFDLLNAGKRCVALDLNEPRDRSRLRDLVHRADVVVEASRPRALAQLGIVVTEAMEQPAGPHAWLSITGFGRAGAGSNRIAYGDVAAAAGGLVVEDDRGVCFCADAVADPLSGVVAAVHVLEALARPEREVLDVSMTDVARSFAGPTLAASPDDPMPVQSPRARPRTGEAGALGSADPADIAALVDRRPRLTDR